MIQTLQLADKDFKITMLSVLKNLQKTGVCWGEMGEPQERGGNYKREPNGNPRTEEYVVQNFLNY